MAPRLTVVILAIIIGSALVGVTLSSAALPATSTAQTTTLIITTSQMTGSTAGTTTSASSVFTATLPTSSSTTQNSITSQTTPYALNLVITVHCPLTNDACTWSGQYKQASGGAYNVAGSGNKSFVYQPFVDSWWNPCQISLAWEFGLKSYPSSMTAGETLNVVAMLNNQIVSNETANPNSGWLSGSAVENC